MSARLQLYVDANFVSPFAMPVFVALHEKGLPFDLCTIDLGRKAQHTPAYAAASLTSKVPTLVHGEFALSESSAITEYIDEVFAGTALYPRDPQQRARARQVQSWLRTDLMPLRRARTSDRLFCKTWAEPLDSEAEEAANKLFAIADRLVPAGAPQLFGEWSVADLELAIMLNRLILSGDPVPQRLVDYAGHQWQRPSVQRWINLKRPAPDPLPVYRHE